MSNAHILYSIFSLYAFMDAFLSAWDIQLVISYLHCNIYFNSTSLSIGQDQDKAREVPGSKVYRHSLSGSAKCFLKCCSLRTSLTLPYPWSCSLMPSLIYSSSSPRTAPLCKLCTSLCYSIYNTRLHFISTVTLPYHLCSISTMLGITYLMSNSKITTNISEN